MTKLADLYREHDELETAHSQVYHQLEAEEDEEESYQLEIELHTIESQLEMLEEQIDLRTRNEQN